MSSTIVPANAEGMPKFKPAAVMKWAWTIYRQRFGTKKKTAKSFRHEFRIALKSAWMTVKYEARQAARTAEQKRADDIAEVRLEIMRVEARPFRMRLDNDRYNRLQNQLSALQAGA